MSYQKLTYVDENDKAEVEQHEKSFGRNNDSLPGLVEITAEQFAQSGFFTWCLQKYETRQINPENLINATLLSPVKCYLSAQVFYFGSPHEDGFVMANDYWTKKVRYFRFTRCVHQYREIGSEEARKLGRTHFGNCYHISVCDKCGEVYEQDSSG